jgi:hypothetical protein
MEPLAFIPGEKVPASLLFFPTWGSVFAQEHLKPVGSYSLTKPRPLRERASDSWLREWFKPGSKYKEWNHYGQELTDVIQKEHRKHEQCVSQRGDRNI